MIRVVPITLVALFVATLSSAAPTLDNAGSRPQSCPVQSIEIRPGQPVQSFVDKSAEGAVFCLRSGIYRLQQVIPKNGQSFYGEDGTVLSGAREIEKFERDGPFFVATGQTQAHARQGRCAKSSPECNFTDRFFIDDRPLQPVLGKQDVSPGKFYLDRSSGRLYFLDDPQGHRAEATVKEFAFAGYAVNVHIENIVIEKYSNPAQTGAISGRSGMNWTVNKIEARWNSGAGISVGSGSRVLNCNIHDNGQLGINAGGKDIVLAGNQIWENNIYGFDFGWEAGGVKVTRSDGAHFLRNYVHNNIGPGLWCDIECRNALYEENVVEYNADAGIFHEISFAAVICKNVVRFNGQSHRPWYWGAEILIAASQDVQVYDNTITVAPDGSSIMLIDQNRDTPRGTRYKTENNTIRNNTIVFQGEGVAGGAADTEVGDENYGIITQGNNLFDHNAYRALDPSLRIRFAWGTPTKLYDCAEFRQFGQETNGSC